MTPRRVNLAALLSDYRAACVDAGIDPQTGNPVRSADAEWWADPSYWEMPGPAHSAVEATAIMSIAAQSRAIAYRRTPAAHNQTPIAISIEYADQHMHEVLHDRAALHDLQMRERHWYEYDLVYDPHEAPLALLHYLRGVEVASMEHVDGVRVEVPIRNAERHKGKHWKKWYDYLLNSGSIRDADEHAA